MRIVEERLELPDRLTLVVENRPASCDPPWIHQRAAIRHGTLLGRDLALYFAAESVGIGETDLAARQKTDLIAHVSFAKYGCRVKGRVRAARRVRADVVGDSSGRTAQKRGGCRASRVAEEQIGLRLRRLCFEGG